MNALNAGLGRYLNSDILARIRAAHVGIIGAGGLGSNVAMLLARSGVRLMTIADFDTVEVSNLNRQAFFPKDVGQPKVAALAEYLRALEPSMELTLHQTRVTHDNAPGLFASCPIVVEAVDVATVKAELYETFAPNKSLYVTASGLAGFGGMDGEPMQRRLPRPNVVAVGDFSRGVDAGNPPLAPRVMQAAAMEADAVLSFIVSGMNPSP